MKTGPYVVKQDIDRTGFWKKKPPFLGWLDMELTERCNNNCIHCGINLPAGDLDAKRKELSTDEIKNILKEALALGCMVVRFTGGEPLLRDDFEELFIFSRKQGLKVIIFTNATLITSRMAELFSRIPPLEKIEISLYGMEKSSYESVSRVNGSFEAAHRGIKLLLEKNVPFVVKGALLPQNKNEIDEFEKWAKMVPWMKGNPPSYSMFFDLRCRRDGKKNELIKKLRVSPEEGVNILTRKKDQYLNGMREFCSRFMRPSGDKLFSCGSGHGSCIDAYGYLHPCMLLKHPDTAYNLKRGSLEDALTNFFPKLKGMKTTNPDYLNRCAKCFLKGLCEQCPAKSWMEYGTLDTPVEYLCEVAHAQARFLGLVSGCEMAWEVADWKERIENFVKKKAVISKQGGIT